MQKFNKIMEKNNEKDANISVGKYGVEYIDLSTPEVQGKFGHDRIDALTKPGYYKLPFRTYMPDGIRNIVVNVVSIFSCEHLDQNIVCYDGDFTWVFYYNGSERCFKPNWEDDPLDDVYNWMDLEHDEDDEDIEINSVNPDHERWWKCMTMPLQDVPQEDLEWAANQDQFNSYTSKNGFLQEIERRKNNGNI